MIQKLPEMDEETKHYLNHKEQDHLLFYDKIQEIIDKINELESKITKTKISPSDIRLD